MEREQHGEREDRVSPYGGTSKRKMARGHTFKVEDETGGR